MHSLQVTNLKKTFGTKIIISNLSLDLKTGDILGIFGSNGCGKSTLLKILFGTAKADSISVFLDRKPINLKDVIPRGDIAYLPQDTFLPKNLKVKDIIPMYFSDGNEQDKIFYAPGIHKMINIRAGNLSMGQLRYLELLLVGNLKHPFLMLDEPFSMIEPLYKELIKEFLINLKTAKGIIITDHYYNDVLAVSTKNILLKEGKAITMVDESELMREGYLPAK